MPRKKVYTEGIRVNIWIPKKHRKMWDMIENKSAFVQLCLGDSVGIMTWGILHKRDPDTYTRPVDKNPPPNIVQDFNEAFPLDPMTKKRIQKGQTEECKTNFPKRHELW